MIDLYQGILIALVLFGNVPEVVAGAGDIDGHSRLLWIFGFGEEVLKTCKLTASADPDFDSSAHIDFDLPAVDGVDPEVFDGGARKDMGSLQRRCRSRRIQCSPQRNF